MSHRALRHLKVNDFAASASDAECCILSKPDFAKGHQRLITALNAKGDASVAERLAVINRGLRACPDSKALLSAREALDREAGIAVTAALDADEAKNLVEQMRLTREVADDASHPQHAVACGDLGSVRVLQLALPFRSETEKICRQKLP